MHFRTPSNRRFVGYSAIGAVAFAAAASLQYYRHRGRPTAGHCPELEIQTTSEANNADNKRQKRENLKRLNALFEHFAGTSPTVAPERNESKLPLLALDDPILLCQLMLNGVNIDRFGKPEFVKLTGTLRQEEIDRILLRQSTWLKKISLGFFYHMPSIYSENAEEEGYRFEERLRSSREEKRLMEFMAQMLLQSELQDAGTANPMGGDLPRLLINFFDKYRLRNKQIALPALKILANSVSSSRECAEMVIQSDWLPLLASMLQNPIHDEERILAHKICVNTLYALGREQWPWAPHLYELFRPAGTETPKIDIILVHGLRGGAFRTWRQKDRPNEKTTLFWPKDWLAKDVKGPVRIIALDYSSRFFRLRKSLETISARSKRFLDEFEQSSIGQRPVLFICHSLGGLLVKQMLLENKALLSNTVGVLFMAVPHTGTPVAMQLGPNFLRPSEDVLLLQPGSGQNRELDEHFRRVADQIPLLSTVVECEETPVFGRKTMLVPIESAAFGRGPVYHLKEHHHHVCKPDSTRAPAYQIVLNFVNDALRHVDKEWKNRE